MPARFKIMKGPNVGTAYELDGELFIGRDAGNDIVVADHTASRHHVKVSVVNGQVFVKDLGSNNGIFVNGAKMTEHVLRETDQLLVGKTLFVLESGEPTVAAGAESRHDRTIVSSVVCRGRGMVAQPSGSGGKAASAYGGRERARRPGSPGDRSAQPGASDDGAGESAGPASGEVTLVGKSAAFKRALELAVSAAAAASPVLLTGESGTGKELFARFMHAGSARFGNPFVALNCAALPETLLENELFGHVKGAFTGAENTCPGKFELAHTGTLFLDEIGDCSPSLQARLLRAVEQKEFFPVGSNKAKRVDVRIIAASNKDLEKAIKERAFRSDLFYRLN
ncbi:MAG: sigma-54-dependent Fis family transcriptional regulator, partial [Planctomycetota bacterium]|nr:sigma-54-dependent Fis family transcriptional regulator [Planctomycetota bacterium]